VQHNKGARQRPVSAFVWCRLCTRRCRCSSHGRGAQSSSGSSTYPWLSTTLSLHDELNSRMLFHSRASVAGERRPLVEKLAQLFKDFSRVNDIFLDNLLSLRFAGLFARAKLVVGWFASALFWVRHHVSRFSLCRPNCVFLREVNSRT